MSGVVVDAESGAPLAGATVIVEVASAGALTAPASPTGFLQSTRGVISDADGVYRLRELPPGRYNLHVSRPGYRSVTLGVELEGRADSRLSVGLSIQPVALAAIEATADQSQPFERDRMAGADADSAGSSPRGHGSRRTFRPMPAS